MLTDRELLELAAKAAGYELFWGITDSMIRCHEPEFPTKQYNLWNPLTDDGDALRLAVKLRLDVSICNGTSYADGTESVFPNIGEPQGKDPYAATRRAIVRAAAEIGKKIEDKC